MPKFQFILLRDNWSININRNFYWYLNRNFNLDSSLHIDRPVNIYRLVNINWFFHNSGDFDSFDDLFSFICWDFLFNLNILRDLNNFLNNSFWPRNMFWDFDLNFNRLFNNYLFYYFLCSMSA